MESWPASQEEKELFEQMQRANAPKYPQGHRPKKAGRATMDLIKRLGND